MHIKKIGVFLFVCLSGFACNDDDYLDGYNQQELFATPSQNEIDEVIAGWESRDLSPDGYTVEQSVEVTSNGAVLKIISFKVAGIKEYGALLIPKSDTPMPVRMFLSGFSYDDTKYSITINFEDASFANPFIFAVPAMRGQLLSITVNGTEYTTPISEGRHCDAFDQGADDAIAFLNIIEATEQKADASRVAVRGGSRGGTVALLMGERDERVKMAVGIVGPTDMLGLTSQNVNDLTYQCQFLEGLVQNKQTLNAARLNMIASSPIFFANRLPKTQLHFAEDDQIVPLSQGVDLRNRMTEIGLQDRFEMFIYEGKDHSNIAVDNKVMSDRIEELFSQL